MKQQYERTSRIIGEEGVDRLHDCSVLVFGTGGVGSYVCEGLARAGIGSLTIVDKDVVDETNINRQIIALHSTVGLPKTDVMAARVRDINPECEVRTYQMFYGPDTAEQFDFAQYDYIIDAIDTVTGKLALAVNAQKANTPIISSMGTGNKLDPTAFTVTDIYKTSFCPLARIMRKELRKRGIERLKVVYSEEEALTPEGVTEELPQGRRSIPGSVSFVPSAAGLILAGEVIKDIVNRD